jgi:hypothetical protein
MNHVIIVGNSTSKSPPLSSGIIPLIEVTFSRSQVKVILTGALISKNLMGAMEWVAFEVAYFAVR